MKSMAADQARFGGELSLYSDEVEGVYLPPIVNPTSVNFNQQ
jgi:hypothetical protein